jgi:hypothetical protein
MYLLAAPSRGPRSPWFKFNLTSSALKFANPHHKPGLNLDNHEFRIYDRFGIGWLSFFEMTDTDVVAGYL